MVAKTPLKNDMFGMDSNIGYVPSDTTSSILLGHKLLKIVKYKTIKLPVKCNFPNFVIKKTSQ